MSSSSNTEMGEANRPRRRGRRQLQSRKHSDEQINQSLEVLGFKSWQDLETKGKNKALISICLRN